MEEIIKHTIEDIEVEHQKELMEVKDEERKFWKIVVEKAIKEGKKEERERIVKRFEELFDKYHKNGEIAPPPLLSIILELKSKKL